MREQIRLQSRVALCSPLGLRPRPRRGEEEGPRGPRRQIQKRKGEQCRHPVQKCVRHQRMAARVKKQANHLTWSMAFTSALPSISVLAASPSADMQAVMRGV